MLKYARANVLDYADEYPRLPQDVNPLNPGGWGVVGCVLV